jgi:ParB family chromosome partitioning protein
MARTVNAVRAKTDSPDDPRFAYADRLAATLKLDMATWFTPTAENYFARVSKTGILEALKETKGDIAPAWTKAKKGDLAAIAERQLAETGWLPALLRKAA